MQQKIKVSYLNGIGGNVMIYLFIHRRKWDNGQIRSIIEVYRAKKNMLSSMYVEKIFWLKVLKILKISTLIYFSVIFTYRHLKRTIIML